MIGIDEVGRGCWAGPMVVAAVQVPEVMPDWWGDLRDSKALSARKRERLFDLMDETVDFVWASVPAITVDAVGLVAAERNAITEILGWLPPDADVVMDGQEGFGVARAVVKADVTVPAVSAASIVAKVVRDRYMTELEDVWPGYGFPQHKGYGTPQHREALARLGPCEEHRRLVHWIGATWPR